MANTEEFENHAPPIPLWQTWGLRLIFAAIAIVLGSKQLGFVLDGTADWAPWKGLGHSMLLTLAILSFVGIFHPIKFLPLMLYEIAWKTVWLLVIALPAWTAGRDIPDIVNITASSVGIVVVCILIPWRYVWWRYVVQPIEPWRRNRV